MILECPECHARFLVADSMIPPEGRTVRCGACTHQWFVDAPEGAVAVGSAAEAEQVPLAEAEPELAPMAPGSNVPALKKRIVIPVKPFKIAVPALAALWLILAYYTYFPHWLSAPGLSGIYSMFGVKPVEGLVFADVHMERQQDGSKARFILSGSIVNHAAEARHVPTVRVVLKDKDNNELWSREYPVNQELAAGDVYPFKIANVETAFASSVKSIVLDLGNSLQLKMR